MNDRELQKAAEEISKHPSLAAWIKGTSGSILGRVYVHDEGDIRKILETALVENIDIPPEIEFKQFGHIKSSQPTPS